jgi:hypothetical protein
MTTAGIDTAQQPDLSATLIAAASLIAAAALVDRTGVTGVSVTVCGSDINVQVPTYIGDEPTRAAAVAAYARALSAPVQRVTDRHTWIRTDGVIATHPVRVYTLAEPATAAREVA